MRTLAVILICGVTSAAAAEGSALPKEVKSFIAEREVCEHFHGEPVEGNSPEQIERRYFIGDSIDIYCSGTDKRLAALKRRYKNKKAVMKRLNQYELRIESAETN